MNLKHRWKRSMNYIFLDIDGVMNNQEDWLNKVKEGRREDSMFCDEAWELLSQVIKETGARVILSSSWRAGFVQTDSGIDMCDGNCHLTTRLNYYFEEYGIPIVGLTTSYYDHRGKQIMEYVKQHFSSTDNWIVLDDEDIDIKDYVPEERIIKTEFKTGLLPEHCERIVNYFKGE